MRSYVPFLLIVAAIVGGYALWLTRPTAQPIAPDSLSFSEPEQAADTATPGHAPEKQAEAAAKPGLDLELKPRQQVRPGGGKAAITLQEQPGDREARLRFDTPKDPEAGLGSAESSIREEPHLMLDLKPQIVARPESDKLKFFDREQGRRGFTSRTWLSERVGVQAGVGYAVEKGEEEDEREPAIGLGVILAF